MMSKRLYKSNDKMLIYYILKETNKNIFKKNEQWPKPSVHFLFNNSSVLYLYS